MIGQVWDTIFRVTTVDFLVRFYGILVKVSVQAEELLRMFACFVMLPLAA